MIETLKPSTKNCPRCFAKFECKVNDVSNCQCNMVSISKETTAFLARTNYDCLCKDCLTHFDALLASSQGMVFPAQREMMIEGTHYYTEKGNFVFMELYHLLRGSCCGSGCRHCVYGFKIAVR